MPLEEWEEGLGARRGGGQQLEMLAVGGELPFHSKNLVGSEEEMHLLTLHLAFSHLGEEKSKPM